MLLLLLLSCWCFQESTQYDPATSTAIQAFPMARRELNNCSSTGDCPDGLFCDDHSQCNCFPFKQIVRCGEGCKDSSVQVHNGYCMTYDKQDNKLLIGVCIYSLNKKSSSSKRYAPYYAVQPGKLNETCAKWKRAGVLCGKCLPDNYPLAYSYSLACTPCSRSHWNWLWYIMAAYLPLTLFYFVILFFKVKIMSGHVYMAISVCQALSSSLLVRRVLPYLNNTTESFFTHAIISLYGIWNLDFFRSYYSKLSLCLDILPRLALDYAIAVYPLLLMVVSYLLITLYDKNYRVVTVLWRPFRKLFSLFRRKWDIKTSVIDSFATFFIISNIKLLNVSFDLLAATKIYHFNGYRKNHTIGLLYSADIEFLGKEHLPYAVLALTVSTIFVLVPIAFLILYPFKFFQRFLNLFPFRWYILHTFMDSFLGCYKDGIQPGTRDCRCFLGLFLLLRVIIFILNTLRVGTSPWTVLICIVLSVIIMAVKPFKTPPSHSNLACAAYTLLLTFIFSTFVATNLSAAYVNWDLVTVYKFLSFLAACVPLVDGARVMLVLVVRRRRDILHSMTLCCRRRELSDYEELPGGRGERKEGLSDKILVPENYAKQNLSSFAAIKK